MSDTGHTPKPSIRPPAPTVTITKEQLSGALWSIYEEEDITDPLTERLWERLNW